MTGEHTVHGVAHRPDAVDALALPLYIEVFRSVPTLLLVYVFLFALPGLGLNLPIAGKLIVPIILINAAVIAEIVRACIAALDRGQREAGAAVGLTRGQTMRPVLLPQAIRLVVRRWSPSWSRSSRTRRSGTWCRTRS